MLGCYEISKNKISFDTGISKKIIDECFAVLSKHNKIKYVENYVLMVNYLKHQRFNLNMMKSAIDCYNDLPDILKIKGKPIIERDTEGFETLCNGFGMVRKIEVEVEDEIEDEEEPKPIVNDSDIDFDSLLKFINKRTGKNFQVVNATTRTKYKARLREGYTKENIFNAIINATESDWHKKDNFKNLRPTFFCRADKLDLYAFSSTKQQKNKKIDGVDIIPMNFTS